jgi:hypothetical protein
MHTLKLYKNARSKACFMQNLCTPYSVLCILACME